MKATYGEVLSKKPKFKGDDNTELDCREIFKAPVTDSGEKKSAKGLLQVYSKCTCGHTITCDCGTSELALKQSCTPEEEKQGLLTTVFLDGKLIKETNLQEIRERINKCV